MLGFDLAMPHHEERTRLRDQVDNVRGMGRKLPKRPENQGQILALCSDVLSSESGGFSGGGSNGDGSSGDDSSDGGPSGGGPIGDGFSSDGSSSGGSSGGGSSGGGSSSDGSSSDVSSSAGSSSKRVPAEKPMSHSNRPNS